jgi:hypothetical protein
MNVQDWHNELREHGCLIANDDCGGGLELHHITKYGRRLGDKYVLPLCRWHHHWDSPLPMGDAFHKGRKPWEAKHGNQMELWQGLRNKL